MTYRGELFKNHYSDIDRYCAMDVWKDFYVIAEDVGQDGGQHFGVNRYVNVDGSVNGAGLPNFFNIILHVTSY